MPCTKQTSCGATARMHITRLDSTLVYFNCHDRAGRTNIIIALEISNCELLYGIVSNSAMSFSPILGGMECARAAAPQFSATVTTSRRIRGFW